jgi:serine/threonine-protein kinase
MAAPVPREEHHDRVAQAAAEQSIGRGAEGGVDGDFLQIAKAVEIVDPAASNDADDAISHTRSNLQRMRGVPFLTVSINSNPTVEELVTAGKYADAARAAQASGDMARAMQLYERIWDFASAARCARAAGDLARALRNAIDANDEALVAEARTALVATDEGTRAGLEVFAARRRFAEAAELAESLGLLERAADHFLSAHRDLDAARLYGELGRDRDAGQLYERVIEQSAAPDEMAAANLALGLLLARRLQHEPAVRHLQEAVRREATRVTARRALISELAALGLREAARDVLLAARIDDPALPVALDEYLRLLAAEPRGPAAQSDLVAGRYRLDKLLGYGATGRVYRATDEVSGRQVALKMVAGGHARGSPPYERFVREAGIAGSLRHPNVVEVYDFSADFGYLVMEYMVGDSLDRRMERRMGPGAVRRLVADVLAGLEAAHRRGVIHRDIKPANIFYDARGTGKIGDFGVAHLLDLGQTQTGGLIGTLAYMSPEQITGAPLTVAADLYSFGVTLYECLTGRLPFLGPDFVAQHLGEVPPTPSELIGDLPDGWDSVLARLLAKDPAERYGTVEELRRAIAAVEAGGPVRPRALELPRAVFSRPATAAESSRSMPAMSAVTGDEPRYRFETPLGRTDVSTLSRAVDAALDRTVILERYEEGQLDPATERRVYALAKCGNSYLQWVLAFDRTGAVVVYEAPAGMPLGELPGDPPLEPLRAVRLLKRLALAVASLHEAAEAHGAIGGATIVIDDLDHPTLLASGLGRAAPDATPAGDVAALVDLVGRLVGAEPTLDGLVDTLAATLSHPDRAALKLLGGRRSGLSLFHLAEALELALLKVGRQRAGGESRP